MAAVTSTRQDEVRARVRVLALHLTRPSTSEAKVLGELLQYVPPDVEVELVVNREGDGQDVSYLRAAGVRDNVTIHSVDIGLPLDPAAPGALFRRLLARRSHLLRIRRLATEARAMSIDVVYTSQQRFDSRAGQYIARRLGVPHAMHLHYNVKPLGRRMIRRIQNCDLIIAVSEFLARQVVDHGLDRRRVVVVPNSLTLSDRPTRDVGDEVVLGQVGRIEAEKGFTDTIEVFRRLLDEHPGLRLLLVGDGSARTAVEASMASLPADADARSVGWQSDTQPWLDQIDIFLHPARREPFGLAVLEAMAAECPVVCYRDGGVSEVVVDGDTGFLHQVGDVGGLTSSVRQLIADPELRARMGRSGRERVRTVFPPERSAELFADALRETLSRD